MPEFADRIKGVTPSEIREIFKFATLPGFISLAAGSPAAETFPVSQIADITSRLLKSNPTAALDYSVTEGYTPLRSFMKEYMKQHHDCGNGKDDLIITSGAQQVFDLTCKALLNEGDTVICEEPSFIGALNCFRSYGANIVGVPTEDDGININLLEDALKKSKKAKLIYIIPNFQNPSGITTSLEKRKEIYRLAVKYGVLIIEDNPYGDLRFRGENVPDIKSFDTENIVIYAGTFSKTVAPGLRVGFCLADELITAKLALCKQTGDVHSNIMSQMAICEFISSDGYASHLEKIREIYRKKADFTFALLDDKMSDYLTYNKIDGGLFIWCRLKNIPMPDFCRALSEKKVGVVPGTAFLCDRQKKCDYFRINYSAPSEEKLTAAMGIMEQTAKSLTE